MSGRRPPWWAAGVFTAALLARLGFIWLVDQPLLYSHQYTYFTSALKLAEQPHWLEFALRNDEWRTWDQRWTIAPLYYLFAAGVLRLFGPHLAPLQLIQAILDSFTAVAVAWLGRRVAGPRLGAWAGLAYALHWPAFEMPSWTLTENIHTPLLVVGVALGVAAQERKAASFLAGLLLGLSALARSVSSAFVGLWCVTRVLIDRRRAMLVASTAVFLGAALPIGAWIARNVAIGHPPMIETAAYENLWWANQFGDTARYERQHQVVYGQPTAEETREAALHFALKNIRANPDRFVEKIGVFFWHFVRPDWLDSLLRVERPMPAWQCSAGLVLEDLLLLLTVPPFLVFLLAAPSSPARTAILVWTSYYLLMIVVVFHNELRYRSALTPFAFAGAAGGLAVLADRSSRGWRAVLALLVGVALSVTIVKPYIPRAAAAFAAWRGLAPVGPALAGGDVQGAQRAAEAAAARDPRSMRPWLSFGSLLLAADHASEALAAYTKARALDRVGNPIPALALPRLLEQDTPAWQRAVDEADRLSWGRDPWEMLEIAWRELPPPHTDTIELGHGDYGAVRGFLHPRGIDPSVTRGYLTFNQYADPRRPQPPSGTHRWTRHRAWLRLVPKETATAYDLTLTMGIPFPATRQASSVTITVAGKEVGRVDLGPGVQPYRFRIPAPQQGPVVIQLDAPTWCRVGEPAEQGVRVDKLQLEPTR